MSEKKKQSGTFYRKRKARIAAENEKQASILKKFIKIENIESRESLSSEVESRSSEKFENNITDCFNQAQEVPVNATIHDQVGEHAKFLLLEPEAAEHENALSDCEDSSSKEMNSLETENTDNSTQNDKMKTSHAVISHDPGEWPIVITDKIRQILVERGPEQVTNFNFPSNDEGRKFNARCYRRRMCNGQEIDRSWLIYSIAKNVIFCFCCRLFGLVQMSLSSASGFSDWKHMYEQLSAHEKSPNHMRAYQLWMEFSKRVRLGRTIDSENQRVINMEVERWREVFKRLVYVIEFLASQNLALRGKRDVLYDKNNGNFWKLLEFIGKFDIVTADHLRRASTNESHVHYLGKTIQNEIIELLGSKIKQQILDEVSKWTYYSIILDCTPDFSHVEQMTFIIRFVECIKGKEPRIKEHFLGFIPVEQSTGSALTETLLIQLENLKIPLKNMRGQSYDNGANMKGKNSGVQSRILNINSRAFYVPCTTHSLNLVLSDAAQSCLEAVELFSILQQIYNFFASSTHRWAILKKHVPSLTVKPLSQTRWESRINAVIPFRYQIGEIYDALLELSIDERTDALGKNLALSLAKKVKNYKFVTAVVIWHSILFRVNVISKMLQSESVDVSSAVEMIDKTRQIMIEMRSEKGFQQALVDARDLCDSLEIQAEFFQEPEIRPRKKKKQFDYESQDEAPLSPQRRFKQSFYFYILDVTISSLQERFEQLNAVNEKFGFLSNIKKAKHGELLKMCKDLHLALCDGDHNDIDGIQLYHEILVILTLLPEEVTTALEILTYLNLNYLDENFPNLSVALRIFLTLPVTVAAGERSFSKLKLIKTYLRSSMSQERLVGLATISIERDLLQNIDVENVMKDFAAKKARKLNM